MSPERTRHRVFIPFLLLAFPLCVLAQRAAPKSVITIHVGKTGMFSGFGHEHTVIAPIASGMLDLKGLRVSIMVVTSQMRVTDPEMAEKERAEVQSIMLGPKVLDAQKYPEIRFQSSHVDASDHGYRVTGTLDLHGERRDLTFDVTGTPEHYHGKTRFKQTGFGIQPVSGGAGTVKVKDELEIEFDVYPAELKPASQ